MFEHTKHDLSADEVTLNYEALKETAGIALSQVREEIHRHLEIMYHVPLDASAMHHAADRLAVLGKQLAIASETYPALVEGESRSKVKVHRRSK